MHNFTGSNILSVNQLDRESIATIFETANKMQPYAQRKKRTRVLDGAILGNMFFEASTRTRVSFGSAFNPAGRFCPRNHRHEQLRPRQGRIPL